MSEIKDKVKLTVGQDVMVYPPPWRRAVSPRPAKVVSVARVWCRIEATDGLSPRGWNMRLDKQSEGTQYSRSEASFRTMEQHEQWQRRVDAEAFLREEGIYIRSGGKWSTVEGRVKLADLIRGHVAP